MAKQRVTVRGVDMPEVDRELDRISLQWLNDHYPGLAQAIEIGVTQRGHSPIEVRRRVMAQAERYELALRCEQAARAIMAQDLETAIP